MDVDAEAPGAPVFVRCGTSEAERKIGGTLALELLAHASRQQRREKGLDVFARKRVAASFESSADAKDRRHSGDDQQIARPALRDLDQHFFERIALGNVERKRGGVGGFGDFAGVIELADERFQLRIADQPGHTFRRRMKCASVTDRIED